MHSVLKFFQQPHVVLRVKFRPWESMRHAVQAGIAGLKGHKPWL